MPRGTDGREAREKRHEGDADDADALETRFGEGMGMTGPGIRGSRAQQMRSAPPKAQQPGGESGELKDPGESQTAFAGAGEFPSGGGDKGVDFQERDGDDEEEEEERDGGVEGEHSRGGVHGVGDFAENQLREHGGQRNGRGEREGGQAFDRRPGWAEARRGEGKPPPPMIVARQRRFLTAMK